MSTHPETSPRLRSHHAGLLLIAAYKLLGALLFVLVGVGALKLLHKDLDDVIWHALVEVRHWNPESHVLSFLLDKAELLNDPLLKRIGFGAFLYAAVGIVEAIGLYFEKVWAEFLTVAITASFLPIEIREVIVKIGWWKVGLLIANLLVLIYLLYLLGEHAARRARDKRVAGPPQLNQEREPEHTAVGKPSSEHP
ncbi:MAG TPA: DUF2127 domain-containing protein [Terracidiphilus sp.]